MDSEKKVKRKRRPLPEGVAGRLVGMGIEVEVPAVIWEMAKAIGDDPENAFSAKGALKQALDMCMGEARDAAHKQVALMAVARLEVRLEQARAILQSTEEEADA